MLFFPISGGLEGLMTWRLQRGVSVVSSVASENSPRLVCLGNSRSKESKILDQSPGVFCQAPRGWVMLFFFWLGGVGGWCGMFLLGVLEVRTNVFVVGSGRILETWIRWKVTDPSSKTQMHPVMDAEETIFGQDQDASWTWYNHQFGIGHLQILSRKPILRKRKNIFRNDWQMDMLVPWSVYRPAVSCLFMVGSWRFFFK